MVMMMIKMTHYLMSIMGKQTGVFFASEYLIQGQLLQLDKEHGTLLAVGTARNFYTRHNVPRWLTASYHVDFVIPWLVQTSLGMSTFVRLPQDVSDEIEEDPTGGKLSGSRESLMELQTRLEMHLRQDHPPLCGRDHMAYRSAYFLPVKESKFRCEKGLSEAICYVKLAR
ncbi:hypothetical protein OIU76_029938 [Salix suchowensis]|nr:hypothetical protein OIU76_029938 [Salix suchowensis]KAJ6368599.1 hypothetical protein OIU78_001052 [Salix suchowensis]